MKSRTYKEYELTYIPETRSIAARGEAHHLQALMGFHGSACHGDLVRNTDAFVTIPANRAAFFAAEAITSPSAVHENYKKARPYYVSYDVRPLYNAWPSFSLNLSTDRTARYHQVEFLSFAWPKRSVFNASEQGTGKTWMGWTLAHLWHGQRVLIVTNKSLIQEWHDEYLSSFVGTPPIKSVPIIAGGTNSRGTLIRGFRDHPTPVAVGVNYEALRYIEDDLYQFAPDVILCDESWKLKNHQAHCSRIVCELADHARHVCLMTGTPIGNDVGDLWMQMRILYGPNFSAGFKNWSRAKDAFLNRFATFRNMEVNGGRQMRKPVGVNDAASLMTRLEPVWFRATKATSLDLPKKDIRPDTILELPPAMRTLYNAAAEHGEAALGADLSLADERVVMIRLQQLTGGFIPTARPVSGAQDEIGYSIQPEELGGDVVSEFGIDGLEELLGVGMVYEWEMVPMEDCPKLAWTIKFAQDRLEGDPTQRCIIWCRFNHEVRRITEQLKLVLGADRVVAVTGATKEKTLVEIKKSFNSRDPDGVQVIVAQIKKLFAGHNLQAADHHIRHSYPFSWIEWSQAEDRSHREGRKEVVTYWTLRIKNSIDGTALTALRNKQNVMNQVSPDSTVGRSMREAILAASYG